MRTLLTFYQLIVVFQSIMLILTLEVTRVENWPKCTCLCCNNFHFHHTKLTRKNSVSLDSPQIFLYRVYFSLSRFSDRFFAVEFKKHVIQLLPLWVANLPKINHMGSVHSANQNHDFKCSVIDPAKPKLKTKQRHSKQQFIRFATFLWVISSFCVDILTKCLTVFINEVIILVYVFRLTLEALLGWKSTIKRQRNISPAGCIGCNSNEHGRNQPAWINVSLCHKNNSFQQICFIFVLLCS